MSHNKLRIAFMGTPEFSVQALKSLIQAGYNIVCVYSQPPRPKGRGQSLQKSPVHLYADALGIDVKTPENFKNNSDIQNFKNLNIDVAVVVAYGLILPPAILALPQYGCINIHASLLPRWRGAAPIQRAILAGDLETGVTIMQMEKGLDTGPEILKQSIKITPQTTTTMLHDALSSMGAQMICDVMQKLEKNSNLDTVPQFNDGVTYAKMLDKKEAKIDWSLPASVIDLNIRALNPWPGTWCETAQGRKLKIIMADLLDLPIAGPAGKILSSGAVITGDSKSIQLITVQPENKKTMAIKDAINGGYIKPDEILI